MSHSGVTALVFPGQGSQAIGMGKAFHDGHDWARAMFATAHEVLGRPLAEICFAGPEETLRQTTNTQPALFVVEAITFEAVRRANVTWSAVAGHSLGEYSALYAAGVAEFADLLRLVQLRAQAMETACPAGTGAMAAVLMLDRATVEGICREVAPLGVCVAANCNCPGQIVISGTAAAVEQAGKLAKERKARRVMPLSVSGPFHSPLMAPAAKQLEEALQRITFRDAQVPVYTNVDAAPTRSGTELKQKLVAQLTGTVRWEETLQRMHTDGFRRFIEVGPGAVLAGLIKKTLAAAETVHGETPADIAALAEVAGKAGDTMVVSS